MSERKSKARKVVLADMDAGQYLIPRNARGTEEQLAMNQMDGVCKTYLAAAGFSSTQALGQLPQRKSLCNTPATCAFRFFTNDGFTSGNYHSECALSISLQKNKGINVVQLLRKEELATASEPTASRPASSGG